MQREEASTSRQEAYVVWEVNTKGKRGRKSGPLSLGEARVLQRSLPTITGHWRCTYVIEPVKTDELVEGEQHGPVD